MEKISKKTLLKIMTQKNNKKGKKIIKRRIKRNIRVKQKKTFNKAPFFVKSVLIILLTFTIIYLFYSREKFSLKVGVVGVRYIVNIGNNLLRYAISVKLKELGYKPYIIGILYERLNNIELIKRTTNVVIIKKKLQWNKIGWLWYLMVNSGQTWRKFDEFLFDQGFLKFEENWTTPRFIYATSFGSDFWPYTHKE